MSSHHLKVNVLLTLFICACQFHIAIAAPPASEPKSFDAAARNNSLALLNDLLNDEKDLSKILIIKRESTELKRLVKDISETAATGAKQLKSLAKKEGLPLENLALPPGELATRKAIAKTKEHLLLHSKDAEFELQLLLTQTEALNYGSHLALVAAENEPQPRHTQEFSQLSAQLKQLHERVVAMLRAKK